MQFKRHIPNTLTCLHLICGLLAIVFISRFQVNWVWAAYLIFCASLFDFLDGFVAKRLNATSKFGAELDSLADMVSFGVAPAFLLVHVFQTSAYPSYICYSPLLLSVFSALRLAKFNATNAGNNHFSGLPVPANALFWTGFAFLPSEHFAWIEIYPWILIILIALFCYLMVSNLRLFSLKFEDFLWKKNTLRYLFILISIFLIFIFKLKAVSLIILVYILFSIFFFRTTSQA